MTSQHTIVYSGQCECCNARVFWDNGITHRTKEHPGLCFPCEDTTPVRIMPSDGLPGTMSNDHD